VRWRSGFSDGPPDRVLRPHQTEYRRHGSWQRKSRGM
jgi:hypothetical protein